MSTMHDRWVRDALSYKPGSMERQTDNSPRVIDRTPDGTVYSWDPRMLRSVIPRDQRCPECYGSGEEDFDGALVPCDRCGGTGRKDTALGRCPWDDWKPARDL